MFDNKTIKNFYELVEDVYKDVFRSKEIKVYDGNDGFNDENDSYCIDVTCDENIIPWQMGEFYSKLFFLDNNEVDITIVVSGVCTNEVEVNKIIRQHENTPLNDIWSIDPGNNGEYLCMITSLSYTSFGDLYQKIRSALIILFDPNFTKTMNDIIKYLEED